MKLAAVVLAVLYSVSACGTAPKECRPAPPSPDSAILAQAKQADYDRQYQRALDITAEILRFPGDREEAKAWAVRGSTFYLMGNKSKARSAWKRAYEIDPCMKDIPDMIRKSESE
jgi:tetratricopeptide (TPR) repeat protein